MIFFVLILMQCFRAARVSIDNLQKSLKKMDSDIKNLETDLTNSKVPQDNDDQFYNVMLVSFLVKMIT